MRLTDLEPEFLEITTPTSWKRVEADISRADGVFFLCPTCFTKNNGPIGTHGVICWRPKVPLDVSPGPGRWEFEGSGFNDLTLVAGSSSVLLQGGCNAHFFIRNGDIIMT